MDLVKIIGEVKSITKDKYELPPVISKKLLIKFLDNVIFREENPIKFVLATKKNRQPAKSRIELIPKPEPVKQKPKPTKKNPQEKGLKMLSTPKEINQKLVENWNDTYIGILYSQLKPRRYMEMEQSVNKMVKKKEIVILEIFTFYIKNILNELFEYYGSNMKALQTIIDGLDDIVVNINSDAEISHDISKVILKYFNAKNKKIIYDLLKEK